MQSLVAIVENYYHAIPDGQFLVAYHQKFRVLEPYLLLMLRYFDLLSIKEL